MAPSVPNQPCGTRAAYQRHRYHGEEPCAPCKEANRKRTRGRFVTRDRIVAAVQHPAVTAVLASLEFEGGCPEDLADALITALAESES